MYKTGGVAQQAMACAFPPIMITSRPERDLDEGEE
jgi:hypothetical protein